MLWPGDYCRDMKRLHGVRQEPLRFLWGGHNMQTRFSHFGVRPGDTIYPVSVSKKRLYVIARMTVQSVGDLRDYLRENPRDRAMVYHSCAREVLVGTHGSLLHFDVQVPDDVLERWRFANNRGERPIKGLTNGEVTNPMTFQGTYRLTETTARDLFSLLLDREANEQLHTSA